MPTLRSSPSGPPVVVGGSSDIQNESLVEGETITQALENLIAPELVTLYDDFIGGGLFISAGEANNTIHIGDLNWTYLVAGGSLGLARNGNGMGTLRGLYFWSVQASSNRASIFLGSPSLTAESVERVAWRANITTAGNFSGNRRCGLGKDNGAAFGGDGLCFEHQVTTGNGITGSANIQCAAYKGGVRTGVITTINIPQDTFAIYEMRRRSALVWDFYINDVYAATLSDNAIPTAKIAPATQLTGVINQVSSIGVDTFEIEYRRKRSAA